MNTPSIYLDHAATTPLHEEVLEAMMPYLTTDFGNPSAVYGPGRKARHIVERCRADIAHLLGVGPAEIVFTSGGSESNNTVLVQSFSHVVSSKVEHESVRASLSGREHKSSVSWITPERDGSISSKRLKSVLSDVVHSAGGNNLPGLASFMAVNNEVGTINPISELAEVAHQHKLLFHTDGVQAAGMMDLTQITPHVDYLTLSGHKIGAPKGIGLLFVRSGSPFRPLILGGSQEQDRRAGTENVASIVGLATALRLATEGSASARTRVGLLKEIFVSGLKQALPNQVHFNSPLDNTASPHIVSFVCTDSDGRGLDGEMLILGLDIAGVYVSAGSACSSGTVKANSVLTELGMDETLSKGAIRVSFGNRTTQDEVVRAVEIIKETVDRMVVSTKPKK